MTTIEQVFFEAVFADISYVDGLTAGMTLDVLAAKIEKRISAPLAKIIGDRFEVLDVREIQSSGYQGVVFRDKITKELYVANRGTESGLDFIADGNLAVITGVATAQTASMVNWWQQISNPAGTLVQVIASGVMDQFSTVSTVSASGKISDALAQAGGKVRVVGHSLGGHLTTIFASLFSNQVSHSSTFNGAGLFSVGTILSPTTWFINFLQGDPLQNLAALIGTTVQLPDSAIYPGKQDNFYAYNGLSLTTNSLTFTQVGERIGIFNEESINPISNHFLYKLTDSLALMAAIQKLDPTANLAKLNALFEASSSSSDSSNENVLDGIRKLLLGYNIKTTPVFDASNTPTRTEYHKNIQNLLNSNSFKSLQGKVTIGLSNGSLETSAKTDFSSFISLFSLSPIAISGSQSLLESILKSAWGSAYTQWQTDKTLTTVQRTAGEANFSDAWLHDRSAMLSWIMQSNTLDQEPVSASFNDGLAWNFSDWASGQNVSVRQSLFQSQHNVIFGRERGDFIAGGDYTDRLYGAGGNDAMFGFGGDDYLEGGAGKDKVEGGSDNDQLYGNSGNDSLKGEDGIDTLYGGTGNDTLEGGKGNDVLYGGKGFDTYVYNVGDGNDTIVDEDKQGQIIIKRNGSTILTTTLYKESSGNIWSDASGSVKITHNSPWRLVLEDGGVIELGENFQDGDFGIHLAQLPDIITTRTIVGDLNPIPLDPDYPDEYQYDPFGVRIENAQVDSLGNVICDLNNPVPTRSDFLYDSVGNDRIQAGGGNDVIDALRGGDDILEGGSGSDIVTDYHGANNQSFGEYYGEMSDLVSAGEVAEGIDEKGDLVAAGSGTDQLYGSNRNDALFGGGGNDLLAGGGGDDIILADDSITWANKTWSVSGSNFTNLGLEAAVTAGNDNIYGGSGNDTIYAGGGNDSVDGGSGDDSIYGEDGNDSIVGGSGDDIIQGDADWLAASKHGNDYIDGGDGNDIIMGLGSNDELFGGSGNDELSGGDADDYLDGETGDDFLDGEKGNDQLMGGDGNDELAGGDGDDYLDGEAGDDGLFGDDGKDQLFGGDGKDWLEGDKGDDYLDGENDDDILLGGEGTDQLFGGEGNDHLQGDAGNDYLDGEAGDDVLIGGDGDDQLFGGDGNDELQGNAGNNYLDGGDGDDELQGGDGRSVLVGGSGNDTYFVDPSKATVEIYDDFSGSEQNAIKIVGNVNLNSVVVTEKDGKLTVTLQQSTTTAEEGTGGSGTGDAGSAETVCTTSPTQTGDPINFSIGNNSSTRRGMYVGPGMMSTESALILLGIPVPQDDGGVVSYYEPAQLSLSELIALSHDQNEADYCKAGRIAPPIRRDPLILDLDGDGIETTRINTTTYFDHDASGTAERTAWVGKDDGLLVMDRNGDGIISDGRELFGDNTLLKTGRLANSGFEALADLDTNRDGVVDVSDSGFDQLRVWQDANGDAVNTAEELHDLYSLGIKEIRLTSQAVNSLDDKGNTLVSSSTVLREDGTESSIAEYRLQRNLTYTKLTDGTSVAEDISVLPYLSGTGNVTDLYQAMENNSSLKELVAQFVGEADSGMRNALTEQILLVWSGVEASDLRNRGVFMDASKLAVVEAFMGRSFSGVNGSSPNSEATVILDGMYHRMFETNYAQLMMQTHLQDLYSRISWGWDENQHQQVADLSQVTETIAAAMTTDAEAGKQLLGEFARTWRVSNSTDTLSYLNFREFFVNSDAELGWVIDSGGLAVTTSHAGTNRSEAIDRRGTTSLYASYISSGDGADVVYAANEGGFIQNNSGDSVLVGGDGNDYLSGGAGADILDGGSGDDLLNGGIGNDTYVFRRGTGTDRVCEYDADDSQDTIYIGDFIGPDEVFIRRADNDLELSITDSGDRMVVTDWFANEHSRIETVQFADGTAWTVDTIKKMVLTATEYDDILIGYETNDTITGLAGNDQLYGGAGNDTLDGGAGNDRLEGGAGDDAYLFGRGSGRDVVVETSNVPDERNVVQLGAELVPDDLKLMVNGEDLYLAIKDTEDQLQLKDWFSAMPAKVEAFRFADGTVWDRNTIVSMMSVATDTDDYLAGTPYSDLIDGGGGYDTIYGFAGNDVLLGGRDGDCIEGGQGDDILVGGEGEDCLHDDDGVNKLSGGAGGDWLDVQGGINELDGGTGNDELGITAGTNTIMFRRGDGFDYVQTYLTSAYIDGDAVVFAEGIRPEDLSIQIKDSSITDSYGGGEVPMFAAIDGGESGYDYSTYGTVQLAIGIGNDEGMLITASAIDDTYGGEVPMSDEYEYGGEVMNLYNLSIQYFVFADGRVMTLDQIIGMADSGVIGYQYGYWGDDFLLGSVANDTIYGNDGNDKIDARDNNDVIHGQYGDDAISAGSGRDDLYGGTGDDVLAGGSGDDYLYGDQGNDVYVFNRGDGNDYIDNYPCGVNADTDTISFGVDVLPADIRVAVDLDYGDLIFGIDGTEDNLAVSWFDPYNDFATIPDNAIARIQFIDADGNTRIFDLTALVDAHKADLLAADASSPILLFGDDSTAFELSGTVDAVGGDYATAYAQTGDLFATPTYLYGSWRDDTINGRAGDDTIEGGYGDDRLAGGAGDDTYDYYQWDGNDTIDDISTPTDPNSLLFGYGITPDDITLNHDPELGQLLLNITTTGETIRINHFIAAAPYGPHAVEYFKFDDGTVLTWSQMIDKGFDIEGYSWGDTLQGTGTTDRIMGNDGSDTLIGGRGNDQLAGNNGDDLYIYQPGDGVDSIDDYALSGEENRIAFGEGIAVADITQRLTYRDNTLIIRVGDGGDEIHLSNFNPDEADTGPRAIQSFTFSDGTILSYEDLVKNTFILQGDFGNDIIHGTNLVDRLYGYEGEDRLQGGDGNDTLTGGSGNDLLDGGTGSDAYVFHLGDGIDTISDTAALEEGNLIVFGDGITATDLHTRIDGDTLVIEYGNGGDAVVLQNYSYSEINGTHVVEQIEFADGSRIQLSSIVDPGTEGDDLIIGTPFDDVINAKGGNDEVYGLEGNDRLLGGAGIDSLDGGDGDDAIAGGQGDDELDGGAGFDTYLFNLGDGSDLVFDHAEKGVGNILTFGEGISRNDISMAIDGSGLVISYGSLGDRVVIADYNPTGRRSDLPISALQLADGTTINLQELINQTPVVGSISIDQTVTEDTAFSFKLPADAFVDPEALPMTYRVSGPDNTSLPSWISFNPITRTFSGTPGNSEVGSHEVAVTAYDDLGATVSRTLVFTVQNTNDAPTVGVEIGVQNAIENQEFSFTIPGDAFNEIDAGDTLSYAATMADGSALPNWLSLDAVTGTFNGIPGNDNVGSLDLMVTATDQAGATVADSFNITVTGGNNAPTATADSATLTEDRCPPVVSGNVLANDVDPDAGDKLTVANPGFKQGDYGYLGLAADGKYGYILKNQSSDVQSLGRAAQVVDHFGYTVTDGTLSAVSSLDITIKGTNDAPIIAKHLADQSVKNSKAFSFTMPTDSFIDIDKGDSLSYTATTADGKALPSWLKFDAKTGTFSGTAPKNAGYLDIRVTAIDKVAATGSTEGSLSVSDVFQLSFGKSNKDSSSCYEYEDDYKRNNNFDWSKKPGETESYYDNNRDNRFTNAHDDDRLKNNSADSPSHFLDSKQVDDCLREFDDGPSRSTWCDNDIARRWLMVSRALAYDLAELGDEQGRNHRLGADTGTFGRDIAGTIGSTHAFGMDTTLASGNCGTDLKGFKGLNEGIKRM